MLQVVKTKALLIAAVVMLLVALYALAGFVVAPRILRSSMLKDIPQSLGATPTVGEIRFNPFLFHLEIKDFSLATPSGEKLLGFRRLFVGFELSSIWHLAYSFANIEIDAPFVNALVAPDGSLNLLLLRPRAAAARSQDKNTSLPRIRIDSFKVSDGLVAYEDRSRPSPFTARLEPINFELVRFITGVEGGRFTFSGSSKLGERVEWHGHVSVQPIESDGEFQIDGLRAHTLWEYLEDRLSFLVKSGTIDLYSTYEFSMQDPVDFKATVSKIAVNELVIRPKESDVDWVTVPSLVLSGATMDLRKEEARADALTITGLKLATWLEPDGKFNLLKLMESPPAPSSTPAAARSSAANGVKASAATGVPATGVPAVETSRWKFQLGEFALRDASISAEDRTTTPAAKLLLAPLSAKIEGASLELGKPLAVSLESRVNATGSLSASGDLTPQPLSAKLTLKFEGIELTAAQPYILQRTSMNLLGGRLSGDAKVRYGANKPALQIASNFTIVGLHTVDNALHDDFINWDRLDVSGMNFQQNPDRLDVDLVTARKLYARVIIEPDSTLNVKRVLAGPGATVVAPATPRGAPVAMTDPVAAEPARNQRASVRSAPDKQPGAQPTSQPMPMTIKKIALHTSQANFTDLTVQPNFSAGIQNLEGTVLGLSSKENSRAKVDIHGAVDAFSPVAITGDANLLSATLYTDLTMSFRNMELSTFNPYSGKFAGYNITKGKLTTEMHYKVVGDKLDAQHHIIIEQLEFGEKTESKDAVSLPIKLAVGLLKDRNGVITLDLPVTGTLRDPAFQLGKVIWKVFVNAIEKAVTAPFALLGAMFGKGPELQFVDFRSSSADLDSVAVEKVRTIAKAMNERPQLKIEVPIGWVADLDRPALAEAKFSSEVRGIQSEQAGRKKSSAATEFDQLDAAAKVEILTQLYVKNFGSKPKLPDSVTSLNTKPELAEAQANFLSQALHQRIAVSDAELTDLGQHRAAAIQQALLTDTQLDPDRVFLAANGKAKNQDAMVRLELSLK